MNNYKDNQNDNLTESGCYTYNDDAAVSDFIERMQKLTERRNKAKVETDINNLTLIQVDLGDIIDLYNIECALGEITTTNYRLLHYYYRFINKMIEDKKQLLQQSEQF